MQLIFFTRDVSWNLKLMCNINEYLTDVNYFNLTSTIL